MAGAQAALVNTVHGDDATMTSTIALELSAFCSWYADRAIRSQAAASSGGGLRALRMLALLAFSGEPLRLLLGPRTFCCNKATKSFEMLQQQSVMKFEHPSSLNRCVKPAFRRAPVGQDLRTVAPRAGKVPATYFC